MRICAILISWYNYPYTYLKKEELISLVHRHKKNEYANKPKNELKYHNGFFRPSQNKTIHFIVQKLHLHFFAHNIHDG